ncbi:hypothetical protein LEP48_15690 [Isoptericola sp. NEAU-Y5]|uniref:Lipoprotein n=1 Tax=Isoptericola luteus TaxID=2879484 RepID=A0ABS7ZIE1_9MICO|nr:hypothetical protein [Isoptericola sp. NEAU-Y5]MCA5894782.1 hypothetical protein [Isoptericola sp. NEAU-Y5]
MNPRTRLTGLLAAGTLALTGACSAADPPAPVAGSPAAATDSPDAAAEPTESAGTAEPTETAPRTDPAGAEGDVSTPEGSFRAWLAASREPDVDTACGYLTPALVDRMVAEMIADGWPGITDCASMTTATAELYAAFDQSAEVRVEVREEGPDLAELSIVYATGTCGSVVMEPEGGRWVINEQSEEEC